MSESPRGEPPAGKARAEELRSCACATELEEKTKIERRIRRTLTIEKIMMAMYVAMMGAGIYFAVEHYREKNRKEKVDCPQISQLIGRANLSEIDMRRLCNNAYVRDCLRSRGACSQ